MMDPKQRAYIFNSFDALKGFREILAQQEKIKVPKKILSEEDLEILDRRIHQVEKGMIVTVTMYENGEYIQKTGRVAKISLESRFVQIVKTKIDLKNIIEIRNEEIEQKEQAVLFDSQ